MLMLFQALRFKGARMLTRTVTWRPSVKAWRNWLRPGISWVRLVSGKVTRSRIIQLSVFARKCVSIARKSGLKGLVLYLKVCNTSLIQGLPGGRLHHNSREIGKVAVARSRDGLPRIIPSFARREIRGGNALTIRLWLTFFGVYRVIPCKGRPNFGSIINPGRVVSDNFLQQWRTFIIDGFLPGLEEHTGEELVGKGTSLLGKPMPFVISSVSSDRSEDPEMDLQASYRKLLAGLKGAEMTPERLKEVEKLRRKIKPVPKSATGVPTSFAHRFSSAKNWIDMTWVGLKTNILLSYLECVPGGAGTTQSLWTKLEDTAFFYAQARSKHRFEMPNAHGFGLNVSGRLALLEEPAAKVRVVALVDCWTQWALRPLHDWVFSLLGEIPQDGTFDQLKPIKRLIKKIKPDTVVYSYDLSSATDRIPIGIQKLLLGGVFGEEFAQRWADLLVGRPYVIPQKVARECGVNRFLRYAVGQPMGAYSSWAMLALTHHAMVQFCAMRAGRKGWFDLYAVLGDDIVIADSRVAAKYRALCRLLGVEIGLNKSLVSEGLTLEFAKRIFFRGEDISGLPMNFWVAAQGSSGVACALGAWVTKGGIGNFVRALGTGFKAASGARTALWSAMTKRVSALCVTLTHPLIGNSFAFNTWPEWLWSKSADNSRPLNTDLLTRMSPFCASVRDGILLPAQEFLENYQEDIFFTEKIEDPVTRVVDSATNKAVASAEKSIDLAVKSLNHLEKLNIKFNLVQVSAVISQVWKSAEKAGLVPLPATRAMVRRDIDPYRLKVSNVYKHFKSLRRLAKMEDPTTPVSSERDVGKSP